ncbi:MAG: sigma-54-dependent Fis family transcriptional regulator [bacterium]|nr:sigma-54-dependent Fis family transcriptional regulator [bacterium]
MSDHEDTNNCCAVFVTEEEREWVKAALKAQHGLRQMVGKSKAICDIQKKIMRVTPFNANVLISGESGTGKELVARSIHYLGPRAGKPFIPVNCGAIPENLFENELFGHVKGAFTDAASDQTGLVKAADGGTLFLDEIAAISPSTQVKLLRLLENSEYKPLGGSRTLKADIRITAATNEPLMDLVNSGAFREDLYYRLNVVYFHMPPLKERREDIPLLVEHFAEKYAKKFKRPDTHVSPKSMKTFVAYPWKGNIRELENMIQNLIIMSKSSNLEITDIPLPDREPTSGLETFKVAKENAINNFEKTYLIQLLKEYKGDVAKAAARSGKGRTALWNLIKKHDLQPKQFRSLFI